MDTKSALYHLMDIRLNGIPDEILRNEEDCQQISQKSEEYLEKLDAMTLPPEIRLLIDRTPANRTHPAHVAVRLPICPNFPTASI